MVQKQIISEIRIDLYEGEDEVKTKAQQKAIGEHRTLRSVIILLLSMWIRGLIELKD